MDNNPQTGLVGKILLLIEATSFLTSIVLLHRSYTRHNKYVAAANEAATHSCSPTQDDEDFMRATLVLLSDAEDCSHPSHFGRLGRLEYLTNQHQHS